MIGNWYAAGLYFGYPDCCIADFCARVSGGPETWAPNDSQGLAGNGTGFVPCQACADLVNSGQKTLADLISHRMANHPFPHADIKHFKEVIKCQQQ
jgi:hypothetical protein